MISYNINQFSTLYVSELLPLSLLPLLFKSPSPQFIPLWLTFLFILAFLTFFHSLSLHTNLSSSSFFPFFLFFMMKSFFFFFKKLCIYLSLISFIFNLLFNSLTFSPMHLLYSNSLQQRQKASSPCQKIFPISWCLFSKRKCPKSWYFISVSRPLIRE